MQSANLAFVIGQAIDERHDEPFALAVRGAIEVGVVVPSILRANLAAAGLTVIEGDAALADYGFRSMKHLRRTLIAASGDIIAMGTAGDHDEAVLHAALGWFREHPLPDADVPPGLGTIPGKEE